MSRCPRGVKLGLISKHSTLPVLACRVHLASTNSILRHAALSWFPEVTVRLPTQREVVRSLARWLAATQGEGGWRRRCCRVSASLLRHFHRHFVRSRRLAKPAAASH